MPMRGVCNPFSIRKEAMWARKPSPPTPITRSVFLSKKPVRYASRVSTKDTLEVRTTLMSAFFSRISPKSISPVNRV